MKFALTLAHVTPRGPITLRPGQVWAAHHSESVMEIMGFWYPDALEYEQDVAAAEAAAFDAGLLIQHPVVFPSVKQAVCLSGLCADCGPAGSWVRTPYSTIYCMRSNFYA